MRPGQPIDLPTLANLRELGGWPAEGGRPVAEGLLYRSTRLSTLDDADTRHLAERGIGTVVDLRTRDEAAADPDPQLPGATNLALDVLADSAISAAADLTKLLQNPQQVTAVLSDGGAQQFMTATYRDIVRAPSALAAYRSFFDLLVETEAPVLFHCTTGKDRTGWAAAATLSALGAAREDVISEYLLTNEQLLPRLEKAFDQFAAAGGDPDLLRPVLGVDAAYLQASFETVDDEFGSFEGYLTEGLGLTPERQDRLRERYLR